MKFKYLTLTPPKGSEEWDKMLITVMLIYRYWVIMSYSENLSDITDLGKCEVYYT